MQKHIPHSRGAAALVALALLSSGAVAQLNDTGQTRCIDNAGVAVDCTNATEQPGQDARFGRDARAAAGRLTKICGGAAGFDFCRLDDSGGAAQGSHACVADQVTGLTWSTETLSARNWIDATTAAASYAQCGIDTGWRLPTRRELLSIVHHGAGNPAIDDDAFPGTANAAYWSADAYAPDPDQAWAIDFLDGDTVHSARAELHAARLVVSSANQAPRINLGADIVVPREARPAALTFPAWATGIAAGPPREAGQHLTATLRLLPVTDQKALEFDVPPALDPVTGTLTFAIKHRIYPDSDAPDDRTRDMWYSSAGLARVEVSLHDDGGTAGGGVDTATGVFTIFLDPVPASRDVNIVHPWKATCIPMNVGAFDADTDPQSNAVYPMDPWPYPKLRIVTNPTHGFLISHVSRPTGADGIAGSMWLFMHPTTPVHSYGGLSFNYSNTMCYQPISSTYTGFDSYTYSTIDSDGQESNAASVVIQIFEVR